MDPKASAELDEVLHVVAGEETSSSCVLPAATSYHRQELKNDFVEFCLIRRSAVMIVKAEDR